MTASVSLEKAEMIATGATAEIYARGENQALKVFNANQP